MPKFALDDDGVVVIIGSGAGGGTLAHELTRQGIKVVLLEAGKRESLASFSQVPGEAYAQLTWLDPRSSSGNWSVAKTTPAAPAWLTKTLGGTTTHWGAVTPRVLDWEIRARTRYGAVAGASLADWPISYAELEKYTGLAEARMFVTRRHGIPGLPASNNFKVMYAGAKKLGYQRVHTGYLAINSRAQDDRPPCIQQGFCVQGCKVGAKWSTLYTEIPRAEATGQLDLRIQSMATRIEHDAQGRANAVVYRDANGHEQRQKARVVCVACNAPETTRLLLLSQSGKFSRGLANSSDQLGRNYCHHVLGFATAVFEQPVRMWRGTAQSGLIEDEARNDPKRGFVGGYYLEMVNFDPTGAALAALPYGWGRDFAGVMEGFANMAAMMVVGEDLPRADNRVTLSTTTRDASGLPVAHIHVDEHDNDIAMRKHGLQQARRIFEAAGARRVLLGEGSPQATHNLGTARMSSKPEDGVVNPWGQTHDVKNLFISDGSVFTTPAAANPTLTIVALALRQAQFIRQQLSARAI
jgi:choline dehydrogenase-like flavoprotein